MVVCVVYTPLSGPFQLLLQLTVLLAHTHLLRSLCLLEPMSLDTFTFFSLTAETSEVSRFSGVRNSGKGTFLQISLVYLYKQSLTWPTGSVTLEMTISIYLFIRLFIYLF